MTGVTQSKMRVTVKRIVATAAVLLVAASASSCALVDQMLSDGSEEATSAVRYEPDMYLTTILEQRVGVAPDPSGSLALADGDVTFAQMVQDVTAAAIAARIPRIHENELQDGAPGVPPLRLIYMPIATTSGSWSGENSSIEVTIPGVPQLEPRPDPRLEDDVPGPFGKGAAWDQAKDRYLAAHATALLRAEDASARIAAFPLESGWSDVFGATERLAQRLGQDSTLLIFSDFGDTAGNPPGDFTTTKVTAIQACSATSGECRGWLDAFSQFVIAGGGEPPVIRGHEALAAVIDEALVNGGASNE